MGVFFGLAAQNAPQLMAVKATDFNAGRIIDDEIFYNPDTMTVAEIQAHLDKYSANCDMWGTQAIGYGRKINGVSVNPNISRREYARMMREAGRSDYHDAPYVCVSKYYENPTTHKTNFDTNAEPEEGMISAAQIIYNAAHQYNINPQVLLVMLKKESYVWGDTWPLKNEYNTVMGYACPDNAPCDSTYFGFYNQVMKAAWQLNYYKEHIYSYGYYPYMTNNILYSPNHSCGSKAVYLENIATTSLYIYTPYTPNDAALANYPGEAYCGSYGNRNFFMFFSEWFGDTHYTFTATEASITGGKYQIIPVSDTTKSLQIVESQLQIANRLDTDADVFEITPYETGGMKIVNSATKLSFDVPAGNTSENTQIIAYAEHGGDNQHWKFYKTAEGTYAIATSVNKKMVINHDGKLVPYGDTDTSIRFYLVPVGVEIIDATKAYRITSKAKSNRNLDILGASTSKTFNKVSTYTRNYGESDNQTFNIIYDKSDGYYKIVNTFTKLALDVSDKSTANGSGLVVANADSTCSQKWKITKKDDYYYLQSVCSDKAIDLSWNNSVAIYDYHGGDNQLWHLDEPATRPLEEGTYTIASSVDANYHFVDNGYAKDVTLNKERAGSFKFVYDTYFGYYTIYADEENVLDLANGLTKNGANIITYKYHGGNNQRWFVTKNDDGTYSISPFFVNKNIDLWCGDLEEGRLALWDKHSGVNQRWLISK